MFTNAVLFITFARPEYARQTFEGIKNAKPSKLYFYSNKAREENIDEVVRNETIRAFVNEIDWDCEVFTFFRDEHVDIYTSLWSALDWVFENEEQAIVLEEDCVPSIAFFDYCEKLLVKYKDDPRVWLLSGNNFIEGYNPNNLDYTFSRFPFMYGWASWQSRWKKMERININWKEMKSYGLNEQYALSKKKTKYLTNLHERIFHTLNYKNAWDHIVGFSLIKDNAFGVIPSFNLVSNIGLSGHHNNGSGVGFANRAVSIKSNVFEIRNEPKFMAPDYHYDQKFFYEIFYKKTLFHVKLINKLKRIKVKILNKLKY